MADLLKIADVLEKTAALLEAEEASKASSDQKARAAQVQSLSARYASATGEELPADLVEKLAKGDDAVLQAVTQVVSKTAESVESLGRSSSLPDSSHPQTKADRAKAAWDRMGQFLNS